MRKLIGKKEKGKVEQIPVTLFILNTFHNYEKIIILEEAYRLDLKTLKSGLKKKKNKHTSEF